MSVAVNKLLVDSQSLAKLPSETHKRLFAEVLKETRSLLHAHVLVSQAQVRRESLRNLNKQSLLSMGVVFNVTRQKHANDELRSSQGSLLA